MTEHDTRREAERQHLVAGDMADLFTKRGCKTYARLVERLVLDFEGIGLHTDEHREPWDEQHDLDVTIAVARYGRCIGTGTIARVGFVQDELFTWLGAWPHALVDDDGCLHVRIRKTLKSWHENHAELSKPELARLQVTMRVCGRMWCDVLDYWDGGDDIDKISRRRVPFDAKFFLEEIVSRCIPFWQAVHQARQLRRRVDGAPIRADQ